MTQLPAAVTLPVNEGDQDPGAEGVSGEQQATIDESPVRARVTCQRLGAAVLVVTIAMLMANCGGGKPADTRASVADAVKRFENAALNRDATTYCALLTDRERANVLQRLDQAAGLSGPCPTLLRATLHTLVTGRTSANARVTSADVSLRGTRADVRLPGDRKHIQLQDVGGTWKISRLPGLFLAG